MLLFFELAKITQYTKKKKKLKIYENHLADKVI